MAQAQLDLQNHLEQTSFDLTTQTIFNDSPVLLLEPTDQVNAHPLEQIEQTVPTTSSKVSTPPGNTHERPPPPGKNASK